MNKIRVLLAEIHAVVREGLRELIRREADMEVVGEAGDGEETVRLAMELKSDVVLMDIAEGFPKICVPQSPPPGQVHIGGQTTGGACRTQP